MKYWIITYGCQMNHSDSERIAAVLENIGYQSTPKENEADLIVVNACSVRQSAIDRTWGQTKKFGKLKTINYKLKTILTGCVLSKDKIKFSQRFDFVLDIRNLPRLPEIIKKEANAIIRPWLNYDEYYLKIPPKYQNKFTAFVPIMTGCNNFCTFCVVPYTRGGEISRPAKEILCEIKNLIQRDYKEIWLIGQNVNSYESSQFVAENSDRLFQEQKTNFPQLLRIINDIPGNFWVRFTSSHPKDFSDELIETMANCEKVTGYLNLPVQSGDNEILKRMNRPYTIEQYKNLVKEIREKIPNITLSTDVIVGFPGETEKNFQNTVKLFREIKFDMAYIAQFSPRPGTAAFKLKDDIPHREKEKRWKILTEILKDTALEKNKNYVGRDVEILVEENKNGFLIGKIRAYKTVKFKGDLNLIGQFTKVQITQAFPWGLKGELKNEV